MIQEVIKGLTFLNLHHYVPYVHWAEAQYTGWLQWVMTYGVVVLIGIVLAAIGIGLFMDRFRHPTSSGELSDRNAHFATETELRQKGYLR